MDLRTDQGNTTRPLPKRHGIRTGHLSQPDRSDQRRADDGCLFLRRHAGGLSPLVVLASNSCRLKGCTSAARWVSPEIVINSDPCIAYLMEKNTMMMGVGHCPCLLRSWQNLFKGNYLFRTWTDASAIIDYLLFARTTSAIANNAMALKRWSPCWMPVIRS